MAGSTADAVRPGAAPPAARERAAGLADAGALHWLLRAACAAEFVGHGAFGVMTKAAWLPYLGVVGIAPELAWKLMPVIGTVDITLGVVVALRPVPAALLYMAFWGFATATIRPLAGEPVWEFIERVPNWAIPLAFLCVRGLGRSPAKPPPGLNRQTVAAPAAALGRRELDRLLRLAVAGAFVGHGAYGAVMGKAAWFGYFAVLGVPAAVVRADALLPLVGGLEIALGVLALARPAPAFLVFLCAWKVVTELLRPAAGEPLWEFVERGSSMVAPLALLHLRGWPGSLAGWWRG